MSLGKVFHGRMENNDLKAWDEIHYFATTEAGKKGEKRKMTGGKTRWCEWSAAEGEDLDQEDGQKTLKAVELISVKREKPFFLAVGFSKPHDPFYAPRKYFDMYPLEICNPPILPPGWVEPFKHTISSDIFDNFTDRDKLEFLRSY
jgi:iduronate 2-sulfatase